MNLRTTGGTLRVAAILSSGVVVAGLMAAPAAVAASHARSGYAHVGRASRLPAGAHRMGSASATRHISGSVALAPRDPAALQRDAIAVSDPRSTRFHHYLAKGAFAAAYGPTAATVNAVEAALRAGHLTVTSVSSNHMFVHFSGSVGDAESAFRTRLANYRMANGRTGMATTAPVSLPASVASQVVSVLGLNTLLKSTTSFERGSHKSARQPATHTIAHYPGAPNPCAQATGAADDFGGLTDDQIAHAYGVDGLYKNGNVGAGQTVAIFELEPFSMTDLNTFDRCYYGKSAANRMAGRVAVKNVDGGAGVGPGSGESILDIDDVSGVAPGANIEVYEAPNTTTGSMDEYNAIIQDDTAQVVTSSWGFCELDQVNLTPGQINVENQLFQQAALQGQTVLASSGDAGADSCAYQAPTPTAPTLSAGDPGTQPFVIGVGGTTITDAANPPAEQVWNDGNDGGSAGGGVSSVWSAPSWQLPFNDTATAAQAVTNGGLSPCPQSANASMCRETPDVSAQADEYTGGITTYLASFGGWGTSGGTSSSAPLWAAMLADINASAGCHSTGRVGFASPSLYAVASVPSERAASFNDITKGNNDEYVLSNGKFYAAHAGYDMASGLGTPKVTGPNGKPGLATYLCAMAAPNATPRPSVTSVSPATVPTHPAGPVTISGTGFTGAKAVSIGGYPVPASGWSVTNSTTIVVTAVPTAAQAGNGGGGPQDGSGRALVNVTGASGATSPVKASASLLYVDGTAGAPVPSVSGVTAYGGPKAGGNKVTVYGSGFFGSGANRITGVTVGGVPASTVTVINPSTFTMTVPAFASGTTACKSGDDEVNDLCQAQIVVTNANGRSANATIRAPYTGDVYMGVSGGVPLPACVTGKSCEIVPATTEYDYFPAPSITSITTTSPGDSPVWASEQGGTIATIDGKGFDYLGLDATFGDLSNSHSVHFELINVTPTELTVALDGHNPTTEPVARHLVVGTLGGLSPGSTITFAGLPRVTGVRPRFVPDQGGGHIKIAGKGFQGIAHKDGGELIYFYAELGAATEQLSGYAATSDTSVSATTPGNNPGSFVVSVCTITFCSEPTSERSFRASLIDFYEPGDPVVKSVSARSGPASGGTRVVIRGANLSDAVEVDFGKTVAAASSAPELLTNGSNTEIDAVAPPGKAGSTVHIVVTTVESLAEGHPSAKTAATTFHYKPSVPAPPQHITAKPHGTSLAARWKPPASNGGHRITGYLVKAVALKNSPRPDAKAPPPVVVHLKHGHARSAKLTGLRGGWTYFVKVQAINRLGRGLPGESRRMFSIHQPA